VFYQCNSGFGPLGEMSAVCAANGSWSPDPADVTCREVVDCGPPTTPRNGSLENYTNTTEGSVVFYSCDPGLVPEQQMRAVCTGNGWSPNPGDLNCSVSCGAPTPPGNGSIGAHQNTSEGAEILFGCNQGFVPTGQRMAVCQTTGNWFPDPADLVCTGELAIYSHGMRGSEYTG